MEVERYGLDGPPETPPRKVVLDPKPAAASRPTTARSPLQPSRAVLLLTQPALASASTAPHLASSSSEPVWSALSEP